MGQEKQFALNHYDRGMGTPYERLSLWDYFALLNSRHKISSSLELPRDGMYGIMGLNSIYMGKNGYKAKIFVEGEREKEFVKKISDKQGVGLDIEVYSGLKDIEKIPSNSIDLVFAFNVLADYANMLEIVEQMGRISSKYVFFTYMNKKNYGYFIHKMHHRKLKQKWDHTDLGKADLTKISEILKKFNFRLAEKVSLDAPWWPDIGAPIGDVARDLLGRKKEESKNDNQEKWCYSVDDLPYFDSQKLFELRKKMAKDFVIEKKFPNFIKILFAHHIGVLFEKNSSK